MRSSANLSGHPIHPMLVGFPVAYLMGSAILNLWARVSKRPRLYNTAKDLNTLGLATACAAAVPGIVDYTFAVPPQSSAKERATKHALTNITALTLFAAARAGRRKGRPADWTLAAELAGAGLIAAAGYMGGTLVYRNQIGVDHRFADAGKWKVDVLPEPSHGEPTDVGGADDLEPGQMKLLRIGGRRVVLARTEDGYAAFSDRCTHKGGPLADGALICGTVQCPWHGSQFDVHSGAVKAGPARDGIETYPVRSEAGRLLVQLPASIRPQLTSA
jgi:nitrite reductase/ring-hydroxylating ferredoxin subunit/uncharacterized membrane protein